MGQLCSGHFHAASWRRPNHSQGIAHGEQSPASVQTAGDPGASGLCSTSLHRLERQEGPVSGVIVQLMGLNQLRCCLSSRRADPGEPHLLHWSLRPVAKGMTQSAPQGTRARGKHCVQAQTRLPSGSEQRLPASPGAAGALCCPASPGQVGASRSTVPSLTSKHSSEHSSCLFPSVSLLIWLQRRVGLL